MKLYSCLSRGFKIPGARFKGKVRMVKVVTPLNANNVITDFKIEEQNMLYLRYPYLTLEQSKPYTDEQERIKLESKAEWISELKARDKKFSSKSTTLVDKLSHLRHTEEWDVIK